MQAQAATGLEVLRSAFRVRRDDGGQKAALLSTGKPYIAKLRWPLGPVDPPLTVVGPFSGQHGQGEFARQFRADLESARLHVAWVDVDRRRLANHQPVDLTAMRAAPGAVLFLLSPPDFLPLAQQLGWRFFDGRPTLGLWWWEASRFPREWTVAAQVLDEVWAASEYTRQHLATAVGAVVRCPLPRATLALRGRPRQEERTRFLVAFDYGGTVERKNPEGALDAYLQAFPSPRPNVSLTIKTISQERLPFAARRLKRLAKGRPDVRFIEKPLGREDFDALLAASGCFVSLHRAEGLGLGMLEAMRQGTPVIATGFSGNLQFMPADYPLLVHWTAAPIPKGTPLFGRLGGTWAQPDLEHAAGLMRRVVEEPGWAMAAAQQASDHLLRLAASEDLAAFVEARVSSLRPGARPPPGHPMWLPRPGAARKAALVDRWDRRLRRVPWLHKFCMDVFYGRYDPRPRR